MTTQYFITAQPQPQWLAAGDALHHVVSVGSAGPTINCYSDAQGENLLAACTAGATFNFANFGGFFYQAASPSAATVQSSSQKLYAMTVAGSPVSNTASETVAAQFEIPASVLFNGAVMRVRYGGELTAHNGTDTLAHKLYIGPNGSTGDTALVSGAATNAGASTWFSGEMDLQVRAAPGASVYLTGNGKHTVVGAAATAYISDFLVPTAFATNGPLYLTITLLWSTASSSDSALVEYFVVEFL